MKTWIKSVIAAASLAATLSGCSQPDSVCAVARRESGTTSRQGYYSVAWTKTSGDDCKLDSYTQLTMEKYTGAPGSTQKDVAIRPTSFNGVPPDVNTGVADSGSGATNYTASVTISPFTTAYPNGSVTANGETIPTCTTADFPAATHYSSAGTSTGQGASFTFRNVRFLEGASYLGTVFEADVDYSAKASDALGGATCNATYHAVAMAPMATCWRADPKGCPDPLQTYRPMHIDANNNPEYRTDDDCNPIDLDADGDPVPNPDYAGKSFAPNLCDQAYVNAHVNAGDDEQVSAYYSFGYPLSNTLRSNFNMTCDGATPDSSGYCIPAADFPSLRADAAQ